MQKTTVVRGTLKKEYGRTVADVINEVLEKNPGFKLTQTTKLSGSDASCTLLCVFEKED